MYRIGAALVVGHHGLGRAFEHVEGTGSIALLVDEKGVTRLQGFSLRIIGCKGEHASVRRYAGQHEGGRTGKKGDGCAQQYAGPGDMSKGVMHSGVNGVAKRG